MHAFFLLRISKISEHLTTQRSLDEIVGVLRVDSIGSVDQHSRLEKPNRPEYCEARPQLTLDSNLLTIRAEGWQPLSELMMRGSGRRMNVGAHKTSLGHSEVYSGAGGVGRDREKDNSLEEVQSNRHYKGLYRVSPVKNLHSFSQ
ncbi:hypothetical protein RRG08_051352 [Elysia crispata]|uniref:Uncharacterized protein n=1 Tax=Elysia crispata TaxID=231223 RepID=A0AAE1B467_9GAST|nr:hypothetical protein RRG08_051352 [Elysia crispata]